MEFVAQIAELPAMLRYILDSAESHSIPSSVLNKIELACEETLVNIIYYAYPYGEGSINIVCEKDDKIFAIHIRDKGIPFNLLEKDIRLDKDQPIEERKVGGLGIYLVRQLIDDVQYFRDNDENHVVLRMFIS